MAQGGNIPTNRTQTVTFYNTTGIIEKEKGIYLSPSFKNKLAGKEVREIYLDVLNTTAVKDADYTDIPISSWSPEDRTLTVRGNIDDFRLVTEEGDCLNYLVITRNVTKTVNNVSTVYKYYYGFFITGVAQAGGSSVKLTLEPDTFTNVFYLHNKHQLTALEVGTTDYEPFNERMKNCHVNRQHYNRVRIETTYTLFVEMNSVSINPHLEIGKSITIDFTDQAGTEVQGTILDIDESGIGDGDIMIWVLCDEQQEIGEPDNYSSFIYEGSTYTFDYTTQGITWTTNKKYLPDNLKIFLNQEESFKFKYQYRDEKRPYRLSSSELETIKNNNNFSLLGLGIKNKIIKSSISYLVIEMKSAEALVCYRYIKHPDNVTNWTINKQAKNGNLIADNFNRPNAVIVYPFFDVPDLFKKYETDLLNLTIKGSFIQWSGYYFDITSASDVFKTINQKAIADWIYSAYVVRDTLIPDDKISLSLDGTKVLFSVDVPNYEVPTYNHSVLEYVDYNKGLFVGGITNDPDSIGQVTVLHELGLQWGDTSGHPDAKYLLQSGCLTGIMISGYDKKEIQLDLSESMPNLKTSFYDNVLQAEPYRFYSLSYLNYEIAFNKNRYYSDYILKVNYYMSVNGAIKCGFIPDYKVEGSEYLYFNEGMVFTTDSALPLVSDSYSSYYYVNKAQMKNQFAVNEYNRGTDLLQHLLISGPNAVGYSAGKGGMHGGGAGAGASALLETGNQFAQMTDEVVDWAQSTKVIEMNQKAKLADMGAKPDVIKQTGSDVIYDLSTNEANIYLNHYTIDEASYNSIAKFLERFGYQINLYDSLHVNDRVGWNYIKLNSFDINPAFDIMVGQEQDLMRIFSNGVTLLHNKSYLTNGHNYETILEE